MQVRLPAFFLSKVIVQVADIGKTVKPVLCHMTGGNQYWMFRTDGKILRDYLCIGRQVSYIRLNQWKPLEISLSENPFCSGDRG